MAARSPSSYRWAPYALALVLFAVTIAPGQQDDVRVAEQNGLRVPVPAGWQWNEPPHLIGGPLSFNSFASRYDQGGVLPPGGAEIEIAQSRAPTGGLTDRIKQDLTDVQIESLAEAALGSVGGMKAQYTATYGPHLAYRETAIYAVKGATLYRFFLSYHNGDPRRAEWESAFARMLSKVEFPP